MELQWGQGKINMPVSLSYSTGILLVSGNSTFLSFWIKISCGWEIVVESVQVVCWPASFELKTGWKVVLSVIVFERFCARLFWIFETNVFL